MRGACLAGCSHGAVPRLAVMDEQGLLAVCWGLGAGRNKGHGGVLPYK